MQYSSLKNTTAVVQLVVKSEPFVPTVVKQLYLCFLLLILNHCLSFHHRLCQGRIEVLQQGSKEKHNKQGVNAVVSIVCTWIIWK